MLTLVLPWPPADLSPNARIHWAALARAKKAYREACGWHAKAQGARPINADRIDARFTFYPPSRRRIDIDNAIARMKAGIDGIADVIGVDDSKWRMTFEIAPETGGVVEVRIKEQEAQR